MGWVEHPDGGQVPYFCCGSEWSACQGSHSTIAELKTCFAWGYRQAAGEDVFECGWLVEVRGEDGIYAVPCPALAYTIEDGQAFRCESGHEHFDQEWMAAHGAAYVSDAEEAEQLMRPDGKIFAGR